MVTNISLLSISHQLLKATSKMQAISERSGEFWPNGRFNKQISLWNYKRSLKSWIKCQYSAHSGHSLRNTQDIFLKLFPRADMFHFTAFCFLLLIDWPSSYTHGKRNKSLTALCQAPLQSLQENKTFSFQFSHFSVSAVPWAPLG